MATLDDLRAEAEAAMRGWDLLNELVARLLIDPGSLAWVAREMRERLDVLATRLLSIHELSQAE